MESSFLTRDQALSLWSGSTNSKTLDYQRTNPAAAAAQSLQLCPTLCNPIDGSPKDYQIMRIHTKEPLEYKTLYHPSTSSTLCRTPHLNNKQNKNTNLIIRRQDYHLTQSFLSQEKETNKNSAQISPSMKPTQTTGPILGGQIPKGRKNSTLKPGKRRPQTQ